LIGHFWIVARRNTADEILAAAYRRVNVPAIIGFIAGIVIAVPLVIFAPDIPSVIGGLIGGIVVYPIVAKATGHYKKGRLTVKGIGASLDSKKEDSAKTIDKERKSE
jgi:cytosine permease